MVRTSFIAAAVSIFFFLTSAPSQQPSASSRRAPSSSKASGAASDPSGMYSFLKEGEFVQLNIEDGKLTGYISRFGDSDSDKGEFIDQFFDKASYQADRLAFTTKVVHGVWYEFNGTLNVTPDKTPGKEGYRVIKGTLIQHVTDAGYGDKPAQRQVEFKSFPDDVGR
jgi:hypothetical protein